MVPEHSSTPLVETRSADAGAPLGGVTLRRFEAEHFATYRSWFRDAELARRLGPIDAAWLDHILAERDGVQYVALAGEAMVAVAGVVLPGAGHDWGAITDVAVDPTRRRMGVGRLVMRSLFEQPELAHVTTWRAWVEADNAAACAMLVGCDWTPTGLEDGMLEFRRGG